MLDEVREIAYVMAMLHIIIISEYKCFPIVGPSISI